MTDKNPAPMEIEMVKISELNFAKYNPRKINTEQIAKLKESLSKFGFVDPVVANKKNNTIIGGHQRTLCWQDMGNKEVPVFWMDLELEEEKQLNITLNAVSGEWDFEVLKLNFEVDEIKEWGFEVEKFEELTPITETDYSDKNKEIDVDEFSDRMTMKFEFSEEDFKFVQKRLAEKSEEKEVALLKILKNVS